MAAGGGGVGESSPERDAERFGGARVLAGAEVVEDAAGDDRRGADGIADDGELVVGLARRLLVREVRAPRLAGAGRVLEIAGQGFRLQAEEDARACGGDADADGD